MSPGKGLWEMESWVNGKKVRDECPVMASRRSLTDQSPGGRWSRGQDGGPGP